MATDVLQRLGDVLNELRAMDPQALASCEDTLALAKAVDQLDAVAARAFGSFEANEDWAGDGAPSAAHWLAWQHNMALPAARRRRNLGRSLRVMPATERAWLDGEIGVAHVTKLAEAQHRCPELFERDEKLLVDNARTLRHRQFARTVDYWLQRADAEDAERQAERVRDGRRFDCSSSFEDRFFVNGMLDPIGGTIFSEELKRIEHEFFLQDWAKAKERLGRDPHVHELARTADQRRADAAVEMAIRSKMANANGERPAPLFTVLVGYETFHGTICELANRTVVTPGSLVDWLNDAWIERVVFGGPSRVIDVGVRQRLFTGATRRALQVRDLECFHPGCEVVAQDCQGDHIQPFAWGGLTVQDNGRMACPFHNRARHRRSEPPAP